MAEPVPAGAAMRIDKFLWYSRLAKTRSFAQEVAAARHLRIDGRVIEKASASVRVGDTLTFPLHGRVRVIRVLALPVRRGPAPEARSCYADLAELKNVSQEGAGD
ncbi:ribosome-associated heat shock protein Hsp15 [Sphingomonas guangdongensis]|uniref:Ribosome-associated heat shock protein Hsp15 n=2 Tax=Sphingomonas guangdongensis TaxID=1141890 RepID=A0A285QAP7_9SPHN|nr:ribosome-associated heat shock protein Hsp15 [Sphingomonas guangdongensis]